MHVCDDTIQRDNILGGVGVIPRDDYFKEVPYDNRYLQGPICK